MDKSEKMVIYGKQPVREALISTQKIIRLVVAREMHPGEKQSFLIMAQKRTVPVELRPKGELQRFCGPVLHQGIAAEIEPYHYIDEEKLWELAERRAPPLFVILDQIQDPQNLGAILRTAEISGVTAVILPDKGSAAVNATVVKTSAGAVFHLPVHRSGELITLLGGIRRRSITLVALAPGRSESIFRYSFDRPLAVIIGSEGKGVRKNLQNLADATLSIPQKGRTGSLNASASAAILLYEIFRQRSKGI